MVIVVAGDVHGAMSGFYKKLLALQETIGRPIDAVLQVGDLQVYSDESHVDKAAARYGGAGEFPEWFREYRRVPILTFAILGNHDDASLFCRHAGKEVIPLLHLLPQGEVSSISLGGQPLRSKRLRKVVERPHKARLLIAGKTHKRKRPPENGDLFLLWALPEVLRSSQP